MKIIALTGKRHVGKSTLADMLVELGYVKVHAFDPGKAAAVAYFEHIGISPDTAHRMVYGDLKDTPCELLPGCSAPRPFLEKFGRWMGVDLGAEWTLGAELGRLERTTSANKVVIESLVYEAEIVRERGGMIYRVIRDIEGPAGLHTDSAQAVIETNGSIYNTGTLDKLRAAAAAIA